MTDYYKDKEKNNEELVVCWCWLVAGLAVIACCVAVVKWIIALW